MSEDQMDGGVEAGGDQGSFEEIMGYMMSGNIFFALGRFLYLGVVLTALIFQRWQALIAFVGIPAYVWYLWKQVSSGQGEQ